jgi:hypothetical protein
MIELTFLQHERWRQQPTPHEITCDVPSINIKKHNLCARAELISSRLWRCWCVPLKWFEKVPTVEPTEGRVVNIDHRVNEYRYVRRLIVVTDDGRNFLDHSLGDAVRVLRFSQSRIRFIDYLHVGIDGDGVLRNDINGIDPQGRSFIKPHHLLSLDFQQYAQQTRATYITKMTALAKGWKNMGGTWIPPEEYEAAVRYSKMNPDERRAFAAQQAKQSK